MHLLRKDSLKKSGKLISRIILTRSLREGLINGDIVRWHFNVMGRYLSHEVWTRMVSQGFSRFLKASQGFQRIPKEFPDTFQSLVNFRVQVIPKSSGNLPLQTFKSLTSRILNFGTGFATKLISIQA